MEYAKLIVVLFRTISVEANGIYEPASDFCEHGI